MSKRTYIVVSVILVCFISIALLAASYHFEWNADTEPTGIPEINGICYGTIVHVAKLEDGYLVYAHLSPGQRATNKLECLWIYEDSFVETDLMEMIESETPGALFKASTNVNHRDIIDDLVVDIVISMETVSELPGQ